MKKPLLFILSLSLFTTMMAQNYWTTHISTAKIITDKSVGRKSFPVNFKLFDLNINPLRKDLFSVADNISKHTIVITIPNAKGQFEKFEMTEASNFDRKLQARFPQIRAFSGKGITDKSATLKWFSEQILKMNLLNRMLLIIILTLCLNLKEAPASCPGNAQLKIKV